MTVYNFKSFLSNLIIENLHPEIKSIIEKDRTRNAKQTEIANKIKDLTSRGEHTGIEGNMPKGSSRAYLKHHTRTPIMLNGKPSSLETGTKVAIRSTLDKHHNKDSHHGHTLGQMQNYAENGDHYVNHNYRMLKQDSTHKDHYTDNKESGIFPPLIDHDKEHHHWSHIGHARDIKAGEFRSITKTKEFPKGISHEDFSDALDREHNKNNGRYWAGLESREHHLDKIDEHPLVQKFHEYHNMSGNPTHDYRSRKNLGVWEHPDGSNHIVARDHGYDVDVQKAYKDARHRMYNKR
jgi:hypothetical protein